MRLKPPGYNGPYPYKKIKGINPYSPFCMKLGYHSYYSPFYIRLLCHSIKMHQNKKYD